MSQEAPVRTTRLSPVRLGIVVLIVCLPLAWLAFNFNEARSAAKGARAVPTGFAGYVDVTATPTQHFESPATPALQDVILAFVVADKDKPCVPSWGTYFTLDKAARDLDLDRRIEQLRIVDGDVRVSFGGQANDELATVCTDEDELKGAYQDVVDRYELKSIDLDIEGEALNDQQANERRAKAIKSVQDSQQAKDKPLAVWLTLPTSTDGLTAAGLAVVKSMLDAGVDLGGVNGMTMNFGASKPPTEDMSNAVEKAGLRVQQQVAELFAAAGDPLTEAEAWAKTGVTPMIGQNDEVSEQFTIGDAKSVNAWALEKGVGLLSMWSINRDATCGPPLPKVSNITRDTCSGVDQKGQSFADVLAAGTAVPAFPENEPSASASPSSSGSPSASAAPSASAGPVPIGSASGVVEPGSSATPGRQAVVDDPAKSPYPVWDPTTPYPANVKVVWQQQVYQAKRWTTGFAPDTQVAKPEETPWRLIGPVAAGGESPVPLPSVSAGTYPEWDPNIDYPTGSRVQFQNVPYVAKWANKGKQPDPVGGNKHPWAVLLE